jgi:hypothetical protein
MCFKIRFARDWQPIGGIGHLLCSRKGDAKGGWRRTSRTATARHPYLGKRVRYRAKFGALAPCEFLVGTPRRRVPSFRREDAVAGCKGGSRRASRTAAARLPYLGQTNALTRGG